ncbi:hypothetical protein MKK65_04935 [Methylobacterium sp. J-001]|uniref:hypothetical protein n=1 Tax=Methylobacterium sp. J-001 TaxID=2836609 RepID=UPI001FB9FBED|nr:hypothetical protein [Methylobacterium sp. J-001]MCJ2115943.1 hypothetical protein [Methylobacterium sp. J-001]
MDWRFSTFLLMLLAMLIWFSIAPINETMCSSEYVLGVLRDHTKDSALNCFDFWLNRYQTLLSGVLALASAIIAAILLQRQLTANRMQVAAAIGDLDPDFFLEWDTSFDGGSGDLEDGILRIQNYNRRPISLRRIEMMCPRAAFIPAELNIGSEGARKLRVEQIDGSTFAFNRWIEGRDPVGGAVVDVLRLMIVDYGEPALSGTDQEVHVRIDYHLLGNPTEARRVDVHGLIRRR